VRGEPGTRVAGDAEVARIAALANRCRLVLLDMIYRAGSGHAGSSLSCVDIISVLKFDQLRGPAGARSAGLARTDRDDRDVFVLSKGHAAPAWYAALIVGGDLPASEAGTLRAIDSRLQGHPDRTRLDLVDVSSGALGQGLSMALGRARGKRLKDQDSVVYCLLGDGECQEGQVWEALLYAGAHRVSNLVAIIDHNKSQSDGELDDVLPLRPLPDKLAAFGWQVQEVNGHSHGDLREAIRAARWDTTRPSVIIAHTRKGWLGRGRILLDGSHSAVPSAADYAQAVAFLEAGAGAGAAAAAEAGAGAAAGAAP
jgi:transketolase